MREIKFRVYDKEKKKLSSGFNIQSLAKEMVYAVIESWVDNLIWQQYTGLKDNNGVEIYEGDILAWGEWMDDKSITEVRWSSAYSGEQLCEATLTDYEGDTVSEKDSLNDVFYGGINHPDMKIVIGNIFEGVDK